MWGCVVLRGVLFGGGLGVCLFGFFLSDLKGEQLQRPQSRDQPPAENLHLLDYTHAHFTIFHLTSHFPQSWLASARSQGHKCFLPSAHRPVIIVVVQRKDLHLWLTVGYWSCNTDTSASSTYFACLLVFTTTTVFQSTNSTQSLQRILNYVFLSPN